MKRLIILGASGHGKVLADIGKKNGYTKIAFLDDNENVKMCMNYPVIGKISDACKFKKDDFIVAIGNSEIRKQITDKLIGENYNIVTLIHPSAIIAEEVTIGIGTVVMAGAVINPNVVIGKGCIINTCASIDHDNVIEDYVHISVGTHLAGTVSVGEKTWIGIGASVSNNVKICSQCMIGAGTLVLKDIDVPGTYIGVPAKKMKPR